MPFTTRTWDKFHIKSNLKSITVDTFPVTGLLQTQLFLTKIDGKFPCHQGISSWQTAIIRAMMAIVGIQIWKGRSSVGVRW